MLIIGKKYKGIYTRESWLMPQYMRDNPPLQLSDYEQPKKEKTEKELIQENVKKEFMEIIRSGKLPKAQTSDDT